MTDNFYQRKLIHFGRLREAAVKSVKREEAHATSHCERNFDIRKSSHHHLDSDDGENFFICQNWSYAKGRYDVSQIMPTTQWRWLRHIFSLATPCSRCPAGTLQPLIQAQNTACWWKFEKTSGKCGKQTVSHNYIFVKNGFSMFLLLWLLICLLADDNEVPLLWVTGRVTESYTWNDGIVGVCQVQTPISNLIRPVVKLRKLTVNYR